MRVGVWLRGGCRCVQALHGAQGAASVSGGVRSGQLTPLYGQITAERWRCRRSNEMFQKQTLGGALGYFAD